MACGRIASSKPPTSAHLTFGTFGAPITDALCFCAEHSTTRRGMAGGSELSAGAWQLPSSQPTLCGAHHRRSHGQRTELHGPCTLVASVQRATGTRLCVRFYACGILCDCTVQRVQYSSRAQQKQAVARDARRLHIAHCMLHVACCTLRIACCMFAGSEERKLSAAAEAVTCLHERERCVGVCDGEL